MARAGGEDRGLYLNPKDADPKGPNWWILWYDSQGRRHRERAGSKSAARDLYQKRQVEKLTRKKLPEKIRSRPLTVGALIDTYRPHYEEHRTARDYKRHADYMNEEFGSQTLEELRPLDIERYRSRRIREDGVSPATVNRCIAYLKNVINLAIRDGKWEGANPCSRVPQLQENNKRIRYLEPAEEERLKPACASLPLLWEQIEFAFLTGLRQDEQFSLRRQNVNFHAGVITIPLSKHGEARHVPFNSRVREILTEALGRHQQAHVWPGPRNGEQGYSGSAAYHALQKACKTASVPNFTWHDLRHTFCSRLVMEGVELRKVQLLAGHKTLTVTERYAHLAPRHLQEAVERLANTQPTATVPLEPKALAEALRDLLTPNQLRTLGNLLQPVGANSH